MSHHHKFPHEPVQDTTCQHNDYAEQSSLCLTYLLMRETFRFIRDFEGEVPGAAPRHCGNYLLHDLPMARWEADKYLREVLDVIEEKNLVYPTVEE